MLPDPIEEYKAGKRDFLIQAAFQKNPAVPHPVYVADKQPEGQHQQKTEQREQDDRYFLRTENGIDQGEKVKKKGSGGDRIHDRREYTSGMAQLHVSDIGIFAGIHVHPVLYRLDRPVKIAVDDVVKDRQLSGRNYPQGRDRRTALPLLDPFLQPEQLQGIGVFRSQNGGQKAGGHKNPVMRLKGLPRPLSDFFSVHLFFLPC